jgi:hypothetical protein
MMIMNFLTYCPDILYKGLQHGNEMAPSTLFFFLIKLLLSFIKPADILQFVLRKKKWSSSWIFIIHVNKEGKKKTILIYINLQQI